MSLQDTAILSSFTSFLEILGLCFVWVPLWDNAMVLESATTRLTQLSSKGYRV